MLRQLLTLCVCLLFVSLSCAQKQNEGNLPLLYTETFDDGTAENWNPHPKDSWRAEQRNDRYVYHLVKTSEQSGGIRKPTTYSILSPYDVGDFELIVEAKCLEDSTNSYRDLCLFYGFQDDTHFYYTHFSARSDNVHNIIGLVNNADRVKINEEPPGSSAARLDDYKWHQLRIVRRIKDGTIKAYIDDFETPILTAHDTTFTHGKIGVGSFDDTGLFTNIRLYGKIHTSAVEESQQKSLECNVHANYPNPFNASTCIPFSVHSPTKLSLAIYNTSGQLVQRLVDGHYNPGFYSIKWNASYLSSGLYLCELMTAHSRNIQTMILQR